VELSVLFAGTAGSVPSARRGLPALLVRYGGERILVDCGEGTQRQLIRSAGLVELTDVFITHLHLDHWLGPRDCSSRSTCVTRAAAPDLRPARDRRLMARCGKVYGRLGFKLDVIELEPEDAVRRGTLEIQPVNVRHRTLALRYVFAETQDRAASTLSSRRSLGVEFGPDFGRACSAARRSDGVRPEQVVGEPREGRKLVISGDTSPCETLAIAAHGADLLIHEATFGEAEHERAAQTGHSTAAQAAHVAFDADVRLLVSRTCRPLRPAASCATRPVRSFPTRAAPRLRHIEIPFAERGAPRLIRNGEEPAPAPAA